MIKEVINAVRGAAAAMAAKPSALFLALALYLGLLGVAYLFITTREATLLQLTMTAITALAAIALFFALQSIAVRYTSDDGGFRGLLKTTTIDWLKLLAVSLPLIGVAALGLFGFGMLNVLMTKGGSEIGSGFVYTRLIPALRFIFLYFVIPLVAIQLWIAATRDGLTVALKGMGRSVVRAFSVKALLTYLLIFVVFGTIAYLLIFTRTPVSNAWVEIGLLVARLVLASVVIFLGWFLGVGALRQATEKV